MDIGSLPSVSLVRRVNQAFQPADMNENPWNQPGAGLISDLVRRKTVE